MGELNPNIPIITLIGNGLNTPSKLQRFSHWNKSKIQLYPIYKKHTLNIKTEAV